jgi:hypothetical protein
MLADRLEQFETGCKVKQACDFDSPGWWGVCPFLLAVGAVSSGLAVTAGKKLGVIRIRRIAAMAMMVIGVVLMAQGVGLLLM